MPGSVEWLYLQRLRSTKITPQIQKRWMEPLLWYQKDAYDGEFCHDFVCAKDLLCWARNCFDRCGDRWPKADGKLLVRTYNSAFNCLQCRTSHGCCQRKLCVYQCSRHTAAFETDFLPLQTPTEFDEFSLVMEEWYADALPGRPLIMDDLLVFHVYCSSATLVQTKGRASCKEDFVLRALEQCGIPPKGKLEPGVHF